MPISKNGKLQYTQDQYERAKYESSTLEYVRSMGYPIVQKGKYWVSKEHDSLVFAPNGLWFWNSRQMSGGAIEFLTQVEHKTLVEAVLTLAGERVHEQINQVNKINDNNSPTPFAAKKSNTEKQEFALPEKAESQKRLFGYLCRGRHLDSKIVQELLDSNRVYGSIHKGMDAQNEPFESYNVIFVGYDNDGNARSAFRRGASDMGKPFKRDVAGSEKEFAFCLAGYDSADEVAVFEASIDAISHATLEKMENKDYKQIHRISLGGTDGGPLFQFLNDNPQVSSIRLCLDNDEPGINATKALIEKLSQKGFTSEAGYMIWIQKSNSKDFNQDLALRHENQLMNNQVSKPQIYPENSLPTAAPALEEQQDDGFFPEAEAEDDSMERG